MKEASQSTRIHITILGKTNSGKSSLINALTRQEVSIVSHIAGTTTDPVTKSIEIPGVGPCLITDTAGVDDATELGAQRLEKTKKALERTDLAILLFRDTNIEEELKWVELLKSKAIPYINVLNTDEAVDVFTLATRIGEATRQPLLLNALTGEGIDTLLATIAELTHEERSVTITGGLAKAGDVVLLVMPQDPQAPKGRLILPQAQTIRELLDKRCIPIACDTTQVEEALSSLKNPPALVITDSQVLATVTALVPKESKLTTFSILFAHYKGDIHVFAAGAQAIATLTPASRVLIAEACTHAPLTEDIGREKIPRMLRKRIGEALRVDVVSGADFPTDLSDYDLVIHCGACMFNRKHVLSRIRQAEEQGVVITNYGITIAYLTGTLDKVVYP
ncbi:[FeFe] hydrogenase H-cluster maturation GTPase HydF [Bacteroides sp. 214]|uniref:[FeFe] hydrogenase H-cluster maturation GTPase HydF n=1 Tax=Bacteroides sp. 214 TaxID=2302935 RepID=UPI0013D1493A|nr:[FeFe] hydrogenase H-cluster maturation GTPase HydF [Bacteroides sp. 214]NDW12407.1 [FeFe] hydrogenase H-cluster maturation GTPase HydF [Bacteroides sp. 214]